MIFYRIVDNTVYHAAEVDKLGFSNTEPSYIPDEYLEQKEFVVLRTAQGLGDWGIISAMPRLLKEKYPDCKVYVPSPKMLESLFGKENNWKSWANPYENVKTVFENNPYVDDFIDTYDKEIFHDHYRIYDNDNVEIPLVEQMLKFWQFTDEEIQDSQPELYFSEEEKTTAKEILEYIGVKDYITFLISDRYYDNKYNDIRQDWEDKLKQQLNDYQLPVLYWTPKPIQETEFGTLLERQTLDIHNVDARMQLYLKCNAFANIGIQCGVNDMVPRYAPVFTVPRGNLKGNFVKGENYLR